LMIWNVLIQELYTNSQKQVKYKTSDCFGER
jgi:hypothetical protein